MFEKALRAGLPAFDISCSGRFDWQALLSLRQLVRENNIDIVHSHNYKSNLYSYLATRGLGIPLIATCHNWTNTTPMLRAYAALDCFVLRKFERVVTVSSAIGARLLQSGVPESRICEISNGIEADHFRCAVPSFPREYKDQVTIGTICRLVPGKGVEDLLHVVPKIIQDYPRVRFLIAGDGPCRRDFEELAARLGIARHLKFLGFRNDIAAIHASMDIFVLASLNEGLPMSVLEAMAAGNPVIATRVGALPQVIDGTVGTLIDPGDREGLLLGLKHLLDDPHLRMTQGENSHRRASQRFGAERMARQYLQVYEELNRSANPRASKRRFTRHSIAKDVP